MTDLWTAFLLSCFTLLAGISFAASGSVEGTFSAADGVKLHYRIVGKGEPVLLLSGGPGFSSDYLSGVTCELAKAHRCILLDQRGTGKSRMEREDSSSVNLNAFVSDVEALRTTLKYEKLIPVGHSWGAILAIAYAERYPPGVRALVVISPGPITADALQRAGSLIENALVTRLSPEEKKQLAEWSSPERTNVTADDAAVKRNRIVIPAFVADRKFAAEIANGITAETYNDRVARLISEDLARGKLDLQSHLKALKMPVLVVQGRQDPMGDDTARAIHSYAPHVQLVMMDDCGHFPWIEQRDKFYRVMAQFLRQVS